MRPSRLVFHLALAAALGVAACGGDDGGEELSRGALVSKADSICTKAQAEAKAIPAPTTFEDADIAAAYFDKVAPITHKETEDLADLEPAEDVKADWDAFVEKQRAADDLLQTIAKKAKDKDASGKRDLERAGPTGQQVAAAARKLGAKRCG